MFVSRWTEDDGYFEALVSLKEGTSPILKVRAVLNSRGKYEPVVRDFGNGRMVAHDYRIGGEDFNTQLVDAQQRAVDLARMFLQESLLQTDFE